MQALFDSPSSSSTTSSTISAQRASAPNVPSAFRRPRLLTINVKEKGNVVDPQLAAWCAAQQEGEKVLLVAHNDQRDILPARTLPALLREFHDDFPHPVPVPTSDADAAANGNGLTLKPRWVLKYSTVIKERGILADKGYMVYVEWV